MRQCCLVRAPTSYRYNTLNVYEESILTYLAGYFSSIGFDDYDVLDFHLNRKLTFSDLVNADASAYVIALRETVENPHYVRRLAASLAGCNRRVIVYGQTGRLHDAAWGAGIHFVPHDERHLARELGLSSDGPEFGGGLKLSPYVSDDYLPQEQIKRFKGIVETSRGCHFPCKFCFINAGNNYPSRWRVRPPHDVLADVATYFEQKIESIVFYDSEFLGADKRHYDAKRKLLRQLRKQFSGLRYKIYCRADTLLSFNDFDLLKKSGLVQVFLGAESLHQPDLDELGKKLAVGQIVQCIDELVKRRIFVNLSFIVFNRNTTVQSIRSNLDALEALLQRHGRFLGMPNFTFSFETDWRSPNAITDKAVHDDVSYVGIDLSQKEQPHAAPLYDKSLLSLMEVFRLLSYEWSRKMTELSSIADDGAYAYGPVQRWFTELAPFCLLTMRHFLDMFERGDLVPEALPAARDELFERIGQFYELLPSAHSAFATFTEHASKLTYRGAPERLEPYEYWDDAIPQLSNDTSHNRALQQTSRII